MQSSVTEVDSCEHLFLAHISEPETNTLRLVIEEASASPESEGLEVHGVVISGLHPVTHQPNSKTFEIIWPSYIAYSVTNESFTGGSDGEECVGRRFVL